MANKSLELSIKANCMRILEILEERDLNQLKTEKSSSWDYNRIPECVELNNRMAQLRKDTLKANNYIQKEVDNMANINSTKYKSNIQEKKVAKDLNAKVTVASGALSFQKADVRCETFLVECKTTAKKFYPLTEATWTRIEKQAIMDGLRVPLMCIGLEDGVNTFAVLNYLDFMCLELDLKAQYLGNTEPKFIEKSSYRITGDFKREPFTQDLIKGHHPCYREDIKFLKSRKHLVILPWEDFIIIAKDHQIL